MNDNDLPSDEQLKAVPQEAIDDTEGYWDKVNIEIKTTLNKFLLNSHKAGMQYLASTFNVFQNVLEYQSDELTIFRKLETYIKTGKADAEVYGRLFTELVKLRLKRQQSLLVPDEQQQKEAAEKTQARVRH